jgi:hypothetical protein
MRKLLKPRPPPSLAGTRDASSVAVHFVAATWNVAGHEPPLLNPDDADGWSSDVAKAIIVWLDPAIENHDGASAGLIAIGLIEVIELSALNVLRESASPDSPSDDLAACGSLARLASHH